MKMGVGRAQAVGQGANTTGNGTLRVVRGAKLVGNVTVRVSKGDRTNGVVEGWSIDIGDRNCAGNAPIFATFP
jgi:hypothetical protein